MKKRKLLALCMAAVMVTPLLSGCGKSDSSDKDNGGKKDVTISMLLCDIASAPYNKDWKVFQWIKDAAGVTFDAQVVPSSDYGTKVNMLFNSGNVPDIITHFYPTASLALNGQLLAINKHMDKLPNLQKFLKDNGYEERWNNLKMADGNIYLLPNMLTKDLWQNHQWTIRKDIFEKNNIPIPKTLDDVIEAGKKLKEIYPDSTPITNRYGSNNIMAGLACAYGTSAGAALGDGAFYDEANKKYIFAPISQNWKDMVTEAHKMYESGVLDEEYTTIDSTVYEQRIITGKTFIMYDYCQTNPKYLKEGKELNPEFDLQIITPPTGYPDTYAITNTNPWNMAMVLPSSLEDDPEHLDEVLSYLNWGFSDEAETLLTFGKEGETYEVKDGVKHYIGDTNWLQQAGIPHNAIDLRQDMDYFLSSLSKEDGDLVLKISKECPRKPAPGSPLTTEDMDKIQVYQTALKDYCTSMMEKFVNGSEPLSNWDKYVQQCKDKGCDKLIDTYNKALQSQKK